MSDHPDTWDKKLVFCTGQRLWIQTFFDQHRAFCKCKDPVKHLQRCLGGEGGEAFAAAAASGDHAEATGDGGWSEGDLDALVAALDEEEGPAKRYLPNGDPRWLGGVLSLGGLRSWWARKAPWKM
ncbi:ORF2 [Anelloviridae sp.]|nr:ORF2 [Anelloviridae sp.]